MKLLKAEKDNLLLQKKKAQKTYRYYRDYQKEVATARFIHSEMSFAAVIYGLLLSETSAP